MLATFRKWLGFDRTAARSMPAAPRFRPTLQPLEDRLVPVTGVTTLAGGITATDLAQAVVGNDGTTTFSNVNLVAGPNSAGIFVGGASSIGLDTGLVLSSGDAAAITGPFTGAQSSVTIGTPGDPDLDSLLDPTLPTTEATVLEFDFVPTGNTILFTYVFGSDEYNEFVGAGFNDVFGLFLNGRNIAFIPGTTTPVSIDNVNLGSNSNLFVDNTTAMNNVDIDGYTTMFTIPLPVLAGQTNHLKLAVGDVGDTSFDSWVMVGFGSTASGSIGTFRPLRLIYDAANDSYDGNLTIFNNTVTGIPGPTFIVLPDLPPGITVKNPDTIDSVGRPVINVPNPGAVPRFIPIRIPVRFANTTGNAISTYFLDYEILITALLV